MESATPAMCAEKSLLAALAARWSKTHLSYNPQRQQCMSSNASPLIYHYTTAFCIPVASSVNIVTPFLFLITFSMNASPALYELLTRGPLAQ